MPRRMPKPLALATRRSSSTPEERLLAHQAFRYEIGVLRAWEDVRHTAARVVDPRTWIQRHPLGSIMAAGALAAIFMMKKKQPAATPGFRTALRRAGIAVLRRAAISGFMTRMVWRIWNDTRPESPENYEPPDPGFRRTRPYRSPARWH